jgi:hypothetical protein
MTLGHDHLLVAAGQSVTRLDHLGLVTEKEHAASVASVRYLTAGTLTTINSVSSSRSRAIQRPSLPG